MTFDEWLAYGQAQGYCSPCVCSTHDGVPSTLEEDEAWDLGDDPCITIIRPYFDDAQKAAVEANTVAVHWRS